MFQVLKQAIVTSGLKDSLSGLSQLKLAVFEISGQVVQIESTQKGVLNVSPEYTTSFAL